MRKKVSDAAGGVPGARNGRVPDPLQLLKRAIVDVPAVKYASGILGVVAVAALARAYFSSIRNALYATIAMLVLMTLLWVFAQVVRISPKSLKVPATALAWLIFGLTACIPVFVATSVFFGWPKPFQKINALANQMGAGQTEADRVEFRSTAVLAISGNVTSSRTELGLEGVEVSVEPSISPMVSTDSNGNYELKLPEHSPEEIRLKLHKTGFKDYAETVHPPVRLDHALAPSP